MQQITERSMKIRNGSALPCKMRIVLTFTCECKINDQAALNIYTRVDKKSVSTIRT